METHDLSIICFLDGYVDSSRSTWRTVVRSLPFSIGRRPDSDLVLSSANVSGRHAELRRRGSVLFVHDCDSTNGTFVNGSRVSAARRLEDGDTLHFGDQEFVLVLPREDVFTGVTAALLPTSPLGTAELPATLFADERRLRQLVEEAAVRSVFQPIVSFDDGRVVGYEVLGRGALQGGPEGPGELFRTAQSCGLEVELVELFRRDGFQCAQALPENSLLFFNTHPAELIRPERLVSHVKTLCDEYPAGRLVLEIHEQAVADPEPMEALRSALRELEVELAFDDFGTGQARLRELIDMEPRFVKFDIAWIRGIDRASPRRREMISKLVRWIGDMGVETLAEGIETAAEAEVCRDLGFHLAQGYFFGHPAPVEELG